MYSFEFYIAGGVYDDPKAPNSELRKQFMLVRPSQGHPYLWNRHNRNRGFSLCRHHSHLYRIDNDFNLILEEYSSEAYQVEAPKFLEIPEFMRAELRELVKSALEVGVRQ